MGDKTVTAILDAFAGVGEITATILTQCVERAVAKKAVKVFRISIFVAGEVFTGFVLEKFITSHVLAPFPIAIGW